MTRSFVLIALLVSACTGQLTAGTAVHGPVGPIVASSGDDVIVEGGDAPPGPLYGPGEDRHWLQPDDFFVSREPWEQGWIYVHLAKMRQPPAASSKDQALFFTLDSSEEVWTEHFWRTRPAAPGELALGRLVICFNDNQRNAVYHAPASKDSARTGAWFMGRVTDTSDAYKHAVRVDIYNCSVNAVRVVGR